MKDNNIVAVFDNDHDFLEALTEIHKKDFHIVDCYTPFPVHGLDGLLKIKRSRLPYVTFGAGAFGLTVAMLFQVWTSSVDWPINVGGKPMLSIPAFAPIAFEIMVLFGALTTVAAFFYISKLYPAKEAEMIYDVRQSNDKFVAVIDSSSGEEVKTILDKFDAKILS